MAEAWEVINPGRYQTPRPVASVPNPSRSHTPPVQRGQPIRRRKRGYILTTDQSDKSCKCGKVEICVVAVREVAVRDQGVAARKIRSFSPRC
eukprot:8668045-Pyramimonas_sp.AAC.1